MSERSPHRVSLYILIARADNEQSDKFAEFTSLHDANKLRPRGVIVIRSV